MSVRLPDASHADSPADKPVYLEDTRTEVELKYPQLFAGRLLQEGYKACLATRSL